MFFFFAIFQTREEKKIQAIMKAFEQMEKSEARKQESQKHRRESTSDAEAYGKKTPCRKGLKSRKSVDESASRKDDDSVKSSRRNSQTDDEEEEKPSIESFDHKLNSLKEEPKSDETGSRKISMMENCVAGIKTETDDDSEDAGADKGSDNEEENESNCADDIKKLTSTTKTSPGYASPNDVSSPVKVNNRVDDKADSDADKEAGREANKRKRSDATTLRKSTKLQSPSKNRLTKPTPKARAVTKPKLLRGKK